MNALTSILERTRAEVERRRSAVPAEELDRDAAARLRAGRERSLAQALRVPGISVIAEHKRRSPSAGVIREDVSLEHVVGAYERGGAAALSVLTEGEHFGGSLADLEEARAMVELPILRKDFIVDPYQVHEALAFGADAVLLIVAALRQEELVHFAALAADLGLEALVEVHDAPELERALEAGATLIGINNRDLMTLEVDVSRTYELLGRIPAGTVTVAESGLSRREQLDELARAGIDGVLVGEALMRAPDIEAACRRLTAPPREQD
ncbi:MAG: indole-3-glycerol phosphate synthase TrpC [Solirubrobacteraceae bacterium]